MDTTTIEITTEQREELERLKEQGGYNSLKRVIGGLLEDGEITMQGIDEAKARSIAREEINDLVTVRALE